MNARGGTGEPVGSPVIFVSTHSTESNREKSGKTTVAPFLNPSK